MNFSTYIAKRYLFSKKSHNIINVISGISMVGIVVGSMALIIVLSVFNGIEGLVVSLFNTFDPDFVVEAELGKTFPSSTIDWDAVENVPGVARVTQVIEENAVARYGDKQAIVKVRGYSENMVENSALDSLMIDGNLLLQNGEANYAVLGAGVSYNLGLYAGNSSDPLHLFAIKRDGARKLSAESVNQKLVRVSGVFSVQQEFDVTYILIPIRLASSLFGYDDQRSFFEVWLNEDADSSEVRETLEAMLGDDFVLSDRFEQQKELYKIMKSEKWAVFIILTFIILVCAFNVVSSLTLLILDKKRDMTILRSMGADLKTIRLIFMKEGLMITVMGSIIGLLIGTFFCWIQMEFGLIPLGNAGGSFVTDSYPVVFEWLDFLAVFGVVLSIGIFVGWYPVRQITDSSIDSKL